MRVAIHLTGLCDNVLEKFGDYNATAVAVVYGSDNRLLVEW